MTRITSIVEKGLIEYSLDKLENLRLVFSSLIWIERRFLRKLSKHFCSKYF